MPGLQTLRGVLPDEEVSLLESVRTHATGAPLEPQPASRPAVIFSHGDQMNGFLYSNLIEDLASHGYIVLAVDHPGRALVVTYPNGTAVTYSEVGRPADGSPQYATALSQHLRRQLAEREADLRFVRTEFGKGARPTLAPPRRVGALGHSNGGLAAALLCQAPAVVDACINLDGRLDAAPYVSGSDKQPPSKPFLYVTKPFRPLTDEELRREGMTRDQAALSLAAANERDLRLLADAGQAYRVLIRQAEHSSFSDEPLLRNPSLVANLRMTALVRRTVRGFFDATLASPAKPFDMPENADLQFTPPVPRR
jgi:predicted dienelactone hydrolase